MHCCGLSAHECPSRSKLPPQCRTQTQCSARAAHLWPARCFARPRGARLFNESQRLTINLYIIFETTVAATYMSLPAPASSESSERARERSVKRSRQGLGPWPLGWRRRAAQGAGHAQLLYAPITRTASGARSIYVTWQPRTHTQTPK